MFSKVYLIRIYLIQQENTNLFKIGITKKEARKRLLELQTGNANKLKLIITFETKYSFKLETYLLNYYRLKNQSGEWFVDIDSDDFIEICKKGEKIFEILKTNTYLNN